MSDIVERKIKEFENRLDTYIYYNEKISDRREVLIDFLSQAIEQTRRETAEEIHDFIYECEVYDEPKFNGIVDIIAGKVKDKYLSEKAEEEKHDET